MNFPWYSLFAAIRMMLSALCMIAKMTDFATYFAVMTIFWEMKHDNARL